MPIYAELLVLGEALAGLPFPTDLVSVDQVNDFGRKDKEAPVDPTAVAMRLFLEPDHIVINGFKRAEPAGVNSPFVLREDQVVYGISHRGIPAFPHYNISLSLVFLNWSFFAPRLKAVQFSE